MADIFISYKAERRPAAEHLAEVLRLYGYSVWFDYELASGADFGPQIERELRRAKAAVVLWCSMSRESRWVLEEAHLAERQGSFVPTWLERVDPPLGFARADTIDLTAWDGSPRSPALDRLLAEIERRVGRRPRPDHHGLAEYERTWRRFGAPALQTFGLVAAPAQEPVFSPPSEPVFSPPSEPVFSPPSETPRGRPKGGSGTVRPPPTPDPRPARITPILSAVATAAVLIGLWALSNRFGSSGPPPPPTSDMVEVPGGEFFMGCNEEVDSDCQDDEKPGGRVRVSSFRIDKTEVTVAAYRECVEAGRCARDTFVTKSDVNRCNWGSSDRDDHPMNCVNWSGADTYCRWKGQRLPTEEEWEKAARGTDGRKYPWGNEGFGKTKVANIADRNTTFGWALKSYDDGYEETAPVGSYPRGASPYGALDMAGNVYEWTSSWYERGKFRSLRGGSWLYKPRYVRASYRDWGAPSVQDYGVGFRCVQ